MRSVILIPLWCLGGCGDNSATPPTDALTIDASSADAPTTDANGPVAVCNEFPGVARVGTWRTLSTSGGPTNPGGTDTLVASDTEIFVVRYRTSGRSIYAYNIAGDAWRNIPIDATAPSVRVTPLVGIARGKLVLYGGRPDFSSTTALNDGASMDLATGIWQPLPATGAPVLGVLGGTYDGAVRVVDAGTSILFLPNQTDNGITYAWLDAADSWHTGLMSGSHECHYLSIGDTEVACINAGTAFVVSRTSTPVATGLNDLSSMLFWGFYPGWAGSTLVAWGGDQNSCLDPNPTWNPYRRVGTSWTAGSAGTVPREEPVMAQLGNRLAIWGGGVFMDPVLSDRADGALYDPATDQWAPMTCDQAPTDGLAKGAVVGGELFILTFTEFAAFTGP